jgi:U3 small nucleolar RNA-associated protein 25
MGLFKNQFPESEDEMEKPEHSTKPSDFDLLFAGDIDDHFLFGMKFTKYVHLSNNLLIIVLPII